MRPDAVNLSPYSVPYSTQCSGDSYGKGYLDFQQIVPPKTDRCGQIWDNEFDDWDNIDLIWDYPCKQIDFTEHRTPNIYDNHYDTSAKFEKIFVFVSCLNRFGGAVYKNLADENEVKLVYDEAKCVGYQSTLTFVEKAWQQTTVGYYRGVAAHGKRNLPSGACVGTEASVMFTRYAEPSYCYGFNPCYELLNLACKDLETPLKPVDPTCHNQPLALPPSIFLENSFCSTNPTLLNARRNIFKFTDGLSLLPKITKVKFCEEIENLHFKAVKVSYCHVQKNEIEVDIDRVSFCYTDSSYIRNSSAISKVSFCSAVKETIIHYEIVSVSYCKTDRPVSKARFCSIDSSTLRNAESVTYCDISPSSFTLTSETVGFCHHNAIASILFSEQKYGTLTNTSNVKYCRYNSDISVLFGEQKRSSLSDITAVKYCKQKIETTTVTTV